MSGDGGGFSSISPKTFEEACETIALDLAELIAAKPTLAKFWVGWFRRSCEV